MCELPRLAATIRASKDSITLSCLLEDGYDIRTVPELLCHRDVRTTMLYLAKVDKARLSCFYAFMRTTVDFPGDLVRRAKARAAARGESLKTLLTRAVASEVGQER